MRQHTGGKAEPVHAGIKMQRAGPARRAGPEFDLFLAGQDRRQVCLAIGSKMAAGRSVQDKDARTKAQRFAQGRAFFEMGDKECAAACRGQRLGHFSRAKPIAICLDHGGRGGGRIQPVNGLPIGGNVRQVNSGARAGSHEGFDRSVWPPCHLHKAVSFAPDAPARRSPSCSRRA